MGEDIQSRASSSLLEAAQLKIHELASALAVGTRFGSIFTRSEDALLFENLATGAGVRVRELPFWLHTLRFTRSTLVHGDCMRQITSISAMGSVSPKTLEGLATFVILCCQWTQTPHATACRLVRDLVTGELGSIVDPGALLNAPGSITSKLDFLLQKFVRATIASDAGSPQAATVRQLLSTLSEKAGRVSFEPIRSDRLFSSDKQMLASLLGRSPENAVARSQRDCHLSAFPRHKDSCIHDTVSIASASIALAAAANDAEVYVECHTTDDVFYLPRRPLNGLDDSLVPIFLVRLWLCQPPPSVSNTIKLSKETPPKSGNRPSHETDAKDFSYPTIFGGQAELGKAAAEILGYHAKYISLETRDEAISMLWDRSFDYGSRLRLQRSTEHWQADFYLKLPLSLVDNDVDPSSEVLLVADILEKSGARREKWSAKTETQKRLLVCAATAIHKLYGLRKYDQEGTVQEVLAASGLVKIAMTIGALHQVTHSDGGEIFAYAISSELLHERNMILWDFLQDATDRGVGTMCLVQAASALWTGTTADTAFPKSQRRRALGGATATYSSASDHTVLGKRGPHGVVILEIIRDPLQFALYGLEKPVVFFSRGSTPLLGHDPQDGFILASERRIIRTVHGITLESELASNTAWKGDAYHDPVITVEPDTADDLQSTIICA
ncbi:hypothetical protein PG984_002634 [Apiospora sp. TS-2023a]